MKVELMKHINKNFAIGGRILFFKKQVVNNYYYKYYNPISNTTHFYFVFNTNSFHAITTNLCRIYNLF